ncbi:hypothetical protein [Aporhodopirellula aestuarii]|uniref:Uncharacterized protein n=1 Tax=Aporhodopirellula aestuarii TaxID=2950107 RepID=A0ABT0UAS2_9BACT|nr:hypothetical protein [Aporhodopirellula aestuarii]MCM2373907.1 hypothetical protein [Aporhodopirellula aestuarii]
MAADTTQDQLIDMTGGEGGLSAAPVLAAKVIPHGTMVFKDAASGHATPTISAAANRFMGISHERVDNGAGGNGARDVEFYIQHRFILPQDGNITQADVGKRAHAKGNYQITKTETDLPYVGTIEKFISATKVMVKIDFDVPTPSV